jgi:hypothetical protein
LLAPLTTAYSPTLLTAMLLMGCMHSAMNQLASVLLKK